MVSAMPSLSREQTLEHVGEFIGEHIVGQPMTEEKRIRIKLFPSVASEVKEKIATLPEPRIRKRSAREAP